MADERLLGVVEDAAMGLDDEVRDTDDVRNRWSPAAHPPRAIPAEQRRGPTRLSVRSEQRLPRAQQPIVVQRVHDGEAERPGRLPDSRRDSDQLMRVDEISLRGGDNLSQPGAGS